MEEAIAEIAAMGVWYGYQWVARAQSRDEIKKAAKKLCENAAMTFGGNLAQAKREIVEQHPYGNLRSVMEMVNLHNNRFGDWESCYFKLCTGEVYYLVMASKQSGLEPKQFTDETQRHAAVHIDDFNYRGSLSVHLLRA